MVADYGAFVPGPRARLAPLAAGPLDGLTFVVKDLIDIVGHVTGAGNPDWAVRQGPAARSAPVVERLLRAGAELVGKTVTDELAFSLEGENEHYGTPVNPCAPDQLPGGSSSGSAVAVAAGFADLGLGTDTGGSVRVPASFCGLFGWRPTHGRLPLAGVVPFAPSYDTVGLLARDPGCLQRAARCLLDALPDEQDTVGGARLESPVFADHEGRSRHWSGAPSDTLPAHDTTPPSKLASTSDARPANGEDRQAPRFVAARDAFALADPAAAVVLRDAIEALGAHEEVEVFASRPIEFVEAYAYLQGLDIARTHGAFLASRPRFGPTIQPRFDSVLALDPADFARWHRWRVATADRLHGLLPAGTFLLQPATPSAAPRRFLRGEAAGRFYEVALALNAVAGHAGLPAVTVPITTLNGLPLGLGIVAGPGQDEALLDVVVAIARRAIRPRSNRQ
jgi:amidase